jgi:hypothetical protein
MRSRQFSFLFIVDISCPISARVNQSIVSIDTARAESERLQEAHTW